MEDYVLRIYDRWGSVVFVSYDQSEKWQGRAGNHDYESGSYLYHLEYSNRSETEVVVGSVLVIK